LIKEAFAWIKNHSEAKGIDVFNKKFICYGGHAEEVKESVDHRPSPLEFYTLSGLVDYINRSHTNVICHVTGYKSVVAISDLREKWQDRCTFAECSPMETRGFQFGNWHSIEHFIIEVQSKFVDSEAKANMLRHVSGISSSEVKTCEDDGVSQSVATKNKLGRLETAKLDPIIQLAPYRTFPELIQPESKFLFRLRNRKDELPEVCLFEADGGAWKIEAMHRIASYLTSHAGHKEGNYQVIA